MERPMRIIATSLALLCGTAATAQEIQSQTPAEDLLCEPGIVENLVLDAAQRSHCRALWQGRIDEMRRRNKEHVQRVLEENRQRRELEASLPPPPPPPVTVESFIGRDDLGYGDVVVTDKGPRVFIGKGDEPPKPSDFVTLESPLSPHRGNATQYEGAFPGARRGMRPESRKPPSKPQERQP